MFSPFTAMQTAVDIVSTSPHPENKIAATIFNETEEWSFSHTNFWPEKIEQLIGREKKIGNSSGTVHAETAVIFNAAFKHSHATGNASICITDPFCPNCAKNMAEAGIKTIYIDHKGFDKDFAKRRGDHFDNMSMRVAEKAGMSVYELNRKEERIVPICIAARDYHPANEKPVIIEELDKNTETLLALHPSHPSISSAFEQLQDLKFSVAIAHKNKDSFVIIAPAHPAIGFHSRQDFYEIGHPGSKYSFIQEPCNRLLMATAKMGLTIYNNEIYCTEVPTSREMVNLIGAGVSTLIIKDKQQARDHYALEALSILEKKKLFHLR